MMTIYDMCTGEMLAQSTETGSTDKARRHTLPGSSDHGQRQAPEQQSLPAIRQEPEQQQHSAHSLPITLVQVDCDDFINSIDK